MFRDTLRFAPILKARAHIKSLPKSLCYSACIIYRAALTTCVLSGRARIRGRRIDSIEHDYAKSFVPRRTIALAAETLK